MNYQYQFTAQVWQYPGKAGWFFVSVPQDISLNIDKNFADWKRGWGSLKVNVEIGKTKWLTSIFPDKKSGEYLLPIKKLVREKELLKRKTSVVVNLGIII
jgi:hypothetical protein